MFHAGLRASKRHAVSAVFVCDVTHAAFEIGKIA
jgi:hypothetical protein